MKAFKITVSILALLLIIFIIAIFIVINTINIDQYKDQITQVISKQLQRKVTLGDIDLSFSLNQGLQLNLKQLKIFDKPEFSQTEIIEIDEAGLKMNIFSFLKERSISISRVQLKSPQIRIIRNIQGKINVQELAPAENIGIASFGSQAAGAVTNNTAQKKESELKVNVNSFVIKGGTVFYQDFLVSPPLDLQFTEIDLSVSDFSLSNAFPFTGKMNAFSDHQNISIGGKGQIDIDKGQILLTRTQGEIDLESLQKSKISRILPAVADLFPDRLRGNLKFILENLKAGQEGLVGMLLKVNLQDGYVSIKQVPLPLEKITLNMAVNEKDLAVKELRAAYGSGEVFLQGGVEDYLNQQIFQFVLSGQKFSLSELIPPGLQIVKIVGYLEMNYEIAGQGLQPNILMETIKGQGNMDLKEGQIVNVNILRSIFESISIIPNIITKIQSQLPDKYKDILNSKNTAIKKLSFNTGLENQVIEIKEAVLETDGFQIAVSGKVGFDQQAVINSSVIIDADLSRIMVAAVEEFRFIMDTDQHIRIPMRKYEGSVQGFKPLPDLEYFGKKIIKSKGKEEIRKILDKVLDLPEEGQPSPNGQSTGDEKPQQPIRPEQEIIGNILDAIFQ